MKSETKTSWIFYDGECAFCLKWIERLKRIFKNKNFGYASLQTDWVQDTLGLDQNEPLVEMKLLTNQGVVLGGIDAVIYLSKRVWWGWPFFLISQIPGMKNIFGRVYQKIAGNRYCLGGSCQVPPRKVQ